MAVIVATIVPPTQATKKPWGKRLSRARNLSAPARLASGQLFSTTRMPGRSSAVALRHSIDLSAMRAPHDVATDFRSSAWLDDPYADYAAWQRDTPVFRNQDGALYLTR